MCITVQDNSTVHVPGKCHESYMNCMSYFLMSSSQKKHWGLPLTSGCLRTVFKRVSVLSICCMACTQSNCSNWRQR